jgi:hypothetical protein
MGMMEVQYNTSPFYWSGVAALVPQVRSRAHAHFMLHALTTTVPQTYLIALSWGIFRNPYYEIFKKCVVGYYRL